ncbi:MAG: ClbS/DfsB family four-helix bundle protein [Chloroflexi bacterium]|nr:ClbS/DfsB family four-helix bundle protein [Chloroflexota bacterium]
MDKSNLLARTKAARARLDAALARVPDHRMSDVALYELWTLKDFLAHLTVWEQYVIGLASDLTAGRTPEYHFNTVPVDQINAETYAANKDRPLADIRAESAASFAAILRLIEDSPDALLFDPRFWSYTRGHPFERWIASNADEHYDEHLPDVLNFLTRAGL